MEVSDLNTTLNPGATYFAEAQYVTPHEYVWCQAHPGRMQHVQQRLLSSVQRHWHDEFHLFAGWSDDAT